MVELEQRYLFRSIHESEWEQTAELEQICFPPNEACTPAHMKARVAAALELFLVAEDRDSGRIAGFLNGIARTEETSFRDEFFTDASLHERQGRTVFLLGLDVLPMHRGQGLAKELVRQYCLREQGKRDRLVLTCLEEKVPMYRKFGFRDLGLSRSQWGGEAWHEMDRMLSESVFEE